MTTIDGYVICLMRLCTYRHNGSGLSDLILCLLDCIHNVNNGGFYKFLKFHIFSHFSLSSEDFSWIGEG